MVKDEGNASEFEVWNPTMPEADFPAMETC